ACAFDKKHERLYYTPMGINQLRYIDLKAKTPTIYYFEDDQFGALTSPGDVPNQITRMVIAADGNGYALTNNGSHLFRFTTNKKPTITDLGSLTDDAANANFSIHSENGYGGDMIADKSGDMYVITANRRVFKIDIGSKIATYKGSIKGLPKGYSTNGAMVEDGSMVIVCSSNSTEGYYKFDLNTLEAEKISTGASVYNASDLANGNLAFAKKKRNREAQPEEVKPEETISRSEKNIQKALAQKNKISVYPNPVSTGLVKLSFENQPQGKYDIQFTDMSGKLISSREVVISNKIDVQEFKLPNLISKGPYMIKVIDRAKKAVSVNQLIVQ
ncbi:MAG TPA: T9SS type A sorting domain-containing protein, partial [Chitinophagaceae bacterium]|nr:T9SS type A sorting domain-containing protein [Chitinophagaceae bacterium]